MAFEVGSAIARIKSDLSGFKSGISEAKKEANGFGDTLKGVGSSVAGFGQQAAVFTGVLAAGFGLVAKSAIDSASAFELNRVAFETMLGSADKAKKLLKDISDFAVKTPFELPQLVDGAQRLLAYNVEAEKIIPTMTMLGNLSAGLGVDKLPQLILAFGQVKAATKLTGAELRQFSEAGVPLLEALVTKANEAGGVLTKVGGVSKESATKIKGLANSIASTEVEMRFFKETGGKTEKQLQAMAKSVELNRYKLKQFGPVGEATYKRVKVSAESMIDKISDGAVKFSDVEAALAGMTGEGGKFFNLMEKQSNTFSGVMSNIKDEIGRTMRAVMGIDETGDIAEGSIFARMKDAAQATLSGISAITPQIVSTITGIVDSVSNFATQLTTTLQPIIDWVKNNQELVLTFLKGLAIGIGALMIIGGITALVTALVTPLTLVVLAIAALYTAWQTNFLGIRDITTAVFDHFKKVWEEVLMPVITAITTFITENWTTISTVTKAIWDMITAGIEIAWALIYGFITVGLALVQGDWKKAWELVQSTFNYVWAGIQKAFEGAKNFIQSWGGQVLDAIVRPFQDAWNRVSELVNKIKDAMDPNKRHSPSMVDRLKTGVTDLNDAWNKLSIPMPTAASASVANIPMGVGAGTSGGSMVNLTISLDGAIISDEYGAKRMAEAVGDLIVKKLQANIRF